MPPLFVVLRTWVYLVAGAALFIWIPLRLRVFDARFGVRLPVWMKAPGIVLAFAGGILILLCFDAFLRHGKGTPFILDAPKRFVASGPYAYVRNPIYVGQVAFLVGFGFYARSISILLLAAVWSLFVHWLVLYVEEPGLKKKFGRVYEDYCKRVPRWFPRGISLKQENGGAEE